MAPGKYGIPDDVLLAIFYILDVRDLVSCRQVCSQFSCVIASDLSLQYKMTLAFNGLVEPSTSNTTLDLPGRIAGLRKHEAKLHRVNFSCTVTRLLEPAAHILWQPIVSTSGSIAHIITKASGNAILNVYLPSSVSNGDAWCNWDVPIYRPGLPMMTPCLAVDPLQDLLVVAETVRDSWNIHIHLRSLDSGGKHSHPFATVPILKYRTPTTTAGLILPDIVLSTRIFARYVVIVVAGNEEPEELLVWDWRTGSHCLTTGARTRVPLLAFLDDSHLAVTQNWSTDVQVYCVGSCGAPVHGTAAWEGCILHSRPLCILSVSGPPSRIAKWRVTNIFSDIPSEHPSDEACRQRSAFRALPSSAAVVFHLTTGTPDHAKKLLILDSASLQDIFRAAHRRTTPPPQALPFVEWASGCLVLGERAKRGPYLHTARIKPFGSKFALLSYPASEPSPVDRWRTGRPARPRVHVVDINRWVAKRSRVLAEDGDSSGSLVQCWENGTDLDCFVEPLPSGARLPFTVYKCPTITFPEGHYPVQYLATQSGFSLMFVDLLNNKPAGFQGWNMG